MILFFNYFQTVSIKKAALFLIVFSLLSFTCRAQMSSLEKIAAKQKIDAWVDQTNMVISKDSFHRVLNEFQANFRLTNADSKRLLDYFSAKPVDLQWYSIPLNNILKVNVDSASLFYFQFKAPGSNGFSPTLLEQVTPMLCFKLMSKGFVYGDNSLRKLNSKVGLYAQGGKDDIYLQLFGESGFLLEEKKNKLYLISPMMGQSVQQEIEQQVPNAALPKEAFSTSVRDYLDLTPKLLGMKNDTFEVLASAFIEQFYKKSFEKKAKLTNKTPPTAYLEQVQGYVTPEKYWENVQVKLDNIQKQGSRLMIQCSIDGEYVKLKTEQITKEAFLRPFILERDYPSQISSLCYDIIKQFKDYITNLK